MALSSLSCSSPVLAGESSGGYETGAPDVRELLAEAAALVEERDAVELRLLRVWMDVHLLGGVATATGWSQDEWLTLVARLPRKAARRLQAMASRLPAMPVTAALLHDGTLSYEQAATIVEATRSLNGEALAQVEASAARLAADANARGDDPDVRWEVDALVERHRRPREVERAERIELDGPWVVLQPDLDGRGTVIAGLDAQGFATTVAAIEHAAGTPSPDVPRKRQRAEGLVAIASHWLAGPATSPDAAAEVGRARPSVQVIVDVNDLTESFAGQLQRAAGPYVPRLTARAVEVLAEDAQLRLLLTDGRRPLAELAATDDIPASVRRAVRTRDRGCRWPGCVAPVWQTDLHHITWRSEGGNHDPDNLVCLCRRHHRRLDDRRWQVHLEPTTAEFTVRRGRTARPRSSLPPGVVAP